MARHHPPAPQSEIGPNLRAGESSLSVNLLSWLDSVFKDIRFAVRMLRKHIVVTGAAIASLTLALGASLAAFSLIDALHPAAPAGAGAGALGVSDLPHLTDRRGRTVWSSELFSRSTDSGNRYHDRSRGEIWCVG